MDDRTPPETAEPAAPTAQAEIDDRCRLAFSAGTRIAPAALGRDAPLIGAAAVARRHLGS